ncbi:8-amino-7-oxononanoate synthase [hydrothermal vent metagenome]|uniref:8-amino-7-oxononanoate synthase n=1 Tax=hydrothermal vent metagenome TaxID=652676 RepID=A0A3B1D4M1_9ZZZZ
MEDWSDGVNNLWPLLVKYPVFEDRLEGLIQDGLFRSINDRDSPQGRVINTGGRSLINFSSNDYLGLCNHPAINEAVVRAVEEYGTGSGASRLISGGSSLHQRLESLVSRLKGTEASVIFGSGYAANTGVIPAISDSNTTIFSDELNHASLIDGCRLSRARVFIYRHNDIEHLNGLLHSHRKGKSVIITDSVFSMDGDIAPIGELRELALTYDAVLYIDDAHGTGVLGGGEGALSHFGLSPESFIIQMGTLSKALGSCGAFVAATGVVIKWLINTSRTLMYSTALPAHLIAASIEAFNIILNDSSLVERLWKNRNCLVHGFHSIGVDTAQSQTPIVPVMLRDNRSAVGLSGFLMSRGIYAPAIRQPTVRTPRVRFTVSAVHTEEDIDILLKILREARDCGLL